MIFGFLGEISTVKVVGDAVGVTWAIIPSKFFIIFYSSFIIYL